MNRFAFLASGAILMVAGTFLACRREAPPQEQVPVTQEETPAPALDTLAMFVRPHAELTNAYDDFMNRNLAGSAASLRQAAAFVRAEALKATGEAKDALDRVAVKLDQLSTRVESGQVRSVSEIEDVSAQAHYALANFHQMEAAAAWSTQDRTKAGIELQAATSHLGKTLAVLGKGTEAEVSATIEDVRGLADRLVDIAAPVPEQVDRSMAALVQAISRVRSQVDR
jgi:hypothetical protein